MLCACFPVEVDRGWPRLRPLTRRHRAGPESFPGGAGDGGTRGAARPGQEWAAWRIATHAPATRKEAERLQGEADAALEQAEALKPRTRQEDLTVWEMEKVKSSRAGRAAGPIPTGWPAGARATRRGVRRKRQEDGYRGPPGRWPRG